jgi:hypothetical protein
MKSANQLQKMTLTNGWSVDLYSSEGEPFQGYSCDILWLDEDLTNDQAWVPEMQARLADRKGRLIWSAMPHSKNDSLLVLCERADRAAEEAVENPIITKFVFRTLDNPAIDNEEKQKMVERWSAQGSDVLRMRAEGEFTFDSIMMYPSYSMTVHGLPRSELKEGVIPSDWTRFAVVDPGSQICAVLFAAIPPQGDKLVLYDELYIPHCNAVKFGDEFHKKVSGQSFYAFLIDSHGGRLRDIGGGRTPAEQYAAQLADRGVRSKATGSSFVPGSDDVMGGIESVRTAMHIRPNGTPFLRVLEGALPNFQREIKRYRRQSTTVGGQVIIGDRPHPRCISHLMDCLRYLCAYEPRYHAPEVVEEVPWWVEWKKKRDKANGGNGVVYLAPSSYTSEVYVG